MAFLLTSARGRAGGTVFPGCALVVCISTCGRVKRFIALPGSASPRCLKAVVGGSKGKRKTLIHNEKLKPKGQPVLHVPTSRQLWVTHVKRICAPVVWVVPRMLQTFYSCSHLLQCHLLVRSKHSIARSPAPCSTKSPEPLKTPTDVSSLKTKGYFSPLPSSFTPKNKSYAWLSLYHLRLIGTNANVRGCVWDVAESIMVVVFACMWLLHFSCVIHCFIKCLTMCYSTGS